jgi:hypothetical protein
MNTENNWQHKTLENLEKQKFGAPEDAPTPMTLRCLELCRLPLNQFSTEDLRLMIGQQFGLTYLVPMAIKKLEMDLFCSGDYYPGDLLKNVLAIDTLFWNNNKLLWNKLNDLIDPRRTELAMNKIPTQLFDTAFKR